MNPEWHDLIQRYIAGLTTDEEAALFQDSLKRDDAVARLYLRYMNLDVALEAHAGSQAAVTEMLVSPPQNEMKQWTGWLSWRPLTAAAGIVFLMAWWLMQPRDVVDVVLVSGEVTWASDGNKPRLLHTGASLPAGRFETLAEDSLIRLRFHDGTLLEFSGPTRAAVAEGAEKRVRLATGLLTAQVAPQPAGRPMQVITPTAAIEVLGTIFTLDAASDEARLSVEEGRVKLRRLVDDKHTEVAAEHGVVASLDSASSLSPVRSVRPPQQWSALFDPMRERVTGNFVSAAGGDPLHVAAAAKLLSDPMSEGLRLVHWRVQIAPSRKQSAALATLVANSVVELRWRTVRPVTGQVVLKTFRARTGFRGGFSAPLDASSPPDAKGWHTSRLPLSAFIPLKPELGTSPIGLDLLAIEVTTLAESAGLEIAHLSIQPSAHSP
jgi:ferric-dicitrate binding protein FerR (iron transport regulator)